MAWGAGRGPDTIRWDGKQYDLVWPETPADAKLHWPMAGRAK